MQKSTILLYVLIGGFLIRAFFDLTQIDPIANPTIILVLLVAIGVVTLAIWGLRSLEKRGLLGICIGLIIMFVPLPIAIAKYPVSYKFVCQRIAAQPKLADCRVRLKHLSNWGDYQRDYREVAKAKILTVNAVSSAEPGGKRKRSEPITVQLHPVFLTDRLSRSQKLEAIDYRQPASGQVVERINQFLASDQPTFTIDLLNEPEVSTNWPQRDYVLFSLVQIVMSVMMGLAIVLKNIAIYLNNLLPESERDQRLVN